MQLPPPLAPWRTWLLGFDEELALAVGALLQRLQPLLGPLAALRRSGEADPDGIDDLRRRGSYERLLLSEWAIADALPEEFLRRAAAGEHLFLHPRRVQPRGNAQIVALFDCGPLQLGTPRLVHIALAILLAQRAERLGARFGWGCLQEATPLAALDQASDLQSLLLRRSLLPADDTAVAAWRTTLQALPQATECWLIGATAALLPTTHCVTLRRRLDGRIALQLSARHNQRETLLDAPPAAAGERLLRGEFTGLAVPKKPARGTAAAARFGLDRPPLLDHDGKRILLPLLGEPGLLQVRQTPRASQRVESNVLRWRSGASLLAPLFLSRGCGGVLSLAGHLRGWNMDPFKQLARPATEAMNTAPGQGRWLQAVMLGPANGSAKLLLLDNAGNLADYGHQRSEGAPAPDRLTPSILALHAVDNVSALAVCAMPTQAVLLRIAPGSDTETLLRVPTVQTAKTAFIAGASARNQWQGTFAYAATAADGSGANWKLIYCSDGSTRHGEASLPPRVHAIGLGVEPQAPQRHALLGLEADRRRLMLYLPQPLPVFTSDAAIRQAAVCASGARAAVLTERRELLLIDVATQQVLLQVQSPA